MVCSTTFGCETSRNLAHNTQFHDWRRVSLNCAVTTLLLGFKPTFTLQSPCGVIKHGYSIWEIPATSFNENNDYSFTLMYCIDIIDYKCWSYLRLPEGTLGLPFSLLCFCSNIASDPCGMSSSHDDGLKVSQSAEWHLLPPCGQRAR